MSWLAGIIPLRSGRAGVILMACILGRRDVLRLACQAVVDDHFPYLLDLIRLGFAAARLKVQEFWYAVAGENVVIAADAFGEAQVAQQRTKVIESNTVVRTAAQEAVQCLPDPGHTLCAP